LDIKTEDVAEITEAGELFGDSVKLIKTHGGLHVLIGKKEKNSKKPDALAAASHKALAMHQLEKMYGADYRPMIAKSEGEQSEVVMDFNVVPELKKNHLEIQSISKNNEVEFLVSRFGVVLAKYECKIYKNELAVESYSKHPKASDTLGKNVDKISENVKDAMSTYVKEHKLGFKV
jgi:hypothetical protein